MGRKRSIGIVLGSGGARGLAHLGVMTALREAGIRPDVVTGTSMGALVGLAVAADRIEAMTRFALELDWKKALRYFVEPRLPQSGLIEGGRVVEFIRQYSGDRAIEELGMPFAAVATDLARGTEVVLGEGSATEAVRASIAIPGLFTPVRIQKRFLVDGGLVNPVPVLEARRRGAEFVIAVDVTHFDPLTAEQVAGEGGALGGKQAPPLLAGLVRAVERWGRAGDPRLLDVMGLAMRIMESRIAEMRLAAEPPDVLVRPRLGNVYFMDFHKGPEIVQCGYKAGRKAAAEILKKMKMKMKSEE